MMTCLEFVGYSWFECFYKKKLIVRVLMQVSQLFLFDEQLLLRAATPDHKTISYKFRVCNLLTNGKKFKHTF